jgi:hypothetical protein
VGADTEAIEQNTISLASNELGEYGNAIGDFQITAGCVARV